MDNEIANELYALKKIATLVFNDNISLSKATAITDPKKKKTKPEEKDENANPAKPDASAEDKAAALAASQATGSNMAERAASRGVSIPNTSSMNDAIRKPTLSGGGNSGGSLLADVLPAVLPKVIRTVGRGAAAVGNGAAALASGAGAWALRNRGAAATASVLLPAIADLGGRGMDHKVYGDEINRQLIPGLPNIVDKLTGMVQDAWNGNDVQAQDRERRSKLNADRGKLDGTPYIPWDQRAATFPKRDPKWPKLPKEAVTTKSLARNLLNQNDSVKKKDNLSKALVSSEFDEHRSTLPKDHSLSIEKTTTPKFLQGSTDSAAKIATQIGKEVNIAPPDVPKEKTAEKPPLVFTRTIEPNLVIDPKHFEAEPQQASGLNSKVINRVINSQTIFPTVAETGSPAYTVNGGLQIIGRSTGQARQEDFHFPDDPKPNSEPRSKWRELNHDTQIMAGLLDPRTQKPVTHVRYIYGRTSEGHPLWKEEPITSILKRHKKDSVLVSELESGVELPEQEIRPRQQDVGTVRALPMTIPVNLPQSIWGPDPVFTNSPATVTPVVPATTNQPSQEEHDWVLHPETIHHLTSDQLNTYQADIPARGREARIARLQRTFDDASSNGSLLAELQNLSVSMNNPSIAGKLSYDEELKLEMYSLTLAGHQPEDIQKKILEKITADEQRIKNKKQVTPDETAILATCKSYLDAKSGSSANTTSIQAVPSQISPANVAIPSEKTRMVFNPEYGFIEEDIPDETAVDENGFAIPDNPADTVSADFELKTNVNPPVNPWRKLMSTVNTIASTFMGSRVMQYASLDKLYRALNPQQRKNLNAYRDAIMIQNNVHKDHDSLDDFSAEQPKNASEYAGSLNQFELNKAYTHNILRHANALGDPISIQGTSMTLNDIMLEMQTIWEKTEIARSSRVKTSSLSIQDVLPADQTRLRELSLKYDEILKNYKTKGEPSEKKSTESSLTPAERENFSNITKGLIETIPDFDETSLIGAGQAASDFARRKTTVEKWESVSKDVLKRGKDILFSEKVQDPSEYGKTFGVFSFPEDRAKEYLILLARQKAHNSTQVITQKTGGLGGLKGTTPQVQSIQGLIPDLDAFMETVVAYKMKTEPEFTWQGSGFAPTDRGKVKRRDSVLTYFESRLLTTPTELDPSKPEKIDFQYIDPQAGPLITSLKLQRRIYGSLVLSELLERIVGTDDPILLRQKGVDITQFSKMSSMIDVAKYLTSLPNIFLSNPVFADPTAIVQKNDPMVALAVVQKNVQNSMFQAQFNAGVEQIVKNIGKYSSEKSIRRKLALMFDKESVYKYFPQLKQYHDSLYQGSETQKREIAEREGLDLVNDKVKIAKIFKMQEPQKRTYYADPDLTTMIERFMDRNELMDLILEKIRHDRDVTRWINPYFDSPDALRNVEFQTQRALGVLKRNQTPVKNMDPRVLAEKDPTIRQDGGSDRTDYVAQQRFNGDPAMARLMAGLITPQRQLSDVFSTFREYLPQQYQHRNEMESMAETAMLQTGVLPKTGSFQYAETLSELEDISKQRRELLLHNVLEEIKRESTEQRRIGSIDRKAGRTTRKIQYAIPPVFDQLSTQKLLELIKQSWSLVDDKHGGHQWRKNTISKNHALDPQTDQLAPEDVDIGLHDI